MIYWRRVSKALPAAAALADRHYSRRKVGSPQFLPPWQTIPLITEDGKAVFGWWRPDPSSGIRSLNGLDGWTCTIFRNEGPILSSTLILDAELVFQEQSIDIGPDGLLTYVWDDKVGSSNPGCCFKHAGYKAVGRSADNRKTLLQKFPEGFDTGGHMGQIHAAKANRSSRLSKVLDFLRRRGKEGATTREIIENCRVCAVNSIAAELRQNGFKISCTTKCLASGERVATYVLAELSVGVPA